MSPMVRQQSASDRDSVSVCEREVQDLHHSRTLASNLLSLRRCGALCDIKLITGDEEIVAHKVVLAACSEYFQAMFTGSMSESCKSEV